MKCIFVFSRPPSRLRGEPNLEGVVFGAAHYETMSKTIFID